MESALLAVVVAVAANPAPGFVRGLGMDCFENGCVGGERSQDLSRHSAGCGIRVRNESGHQDKRWLSRRELV